MAGAPGRRPVFPNITLQVAASRRVVNAYELVENILLYLPLPQLLLAQRTCKFFQGVIVDSERIKQALFLAPVRSQTVEFYYDVQRYQIHAQERDPDSGWRTSKSGPNVTPLMNPFIPWSRSAYESGSDWREVMAESLSRGYATRASPDPRHGMKRQKKQSWTRMLLTQPPARKLTVGLWIDTTNVEGLRLGQHMAAERARQELQSSKRKRSVLPRPTIQGRQKWRELPRLAQDIKGWEMLAMLHGRNPENDSVAFVTGGETQLSLADLRWNIDNVRP